MSNNITITVEAYDLEHQIQFSDNRIITIEDALGEMYKILALLDFTPQTIADVVWQEVFDDQAHNDMLCREMELENEVTGLQNQIALITGDNLFDILAPGAREDSAVTVTRERLQDALVAIFDSHKCSIKTP